MKIDIPYYIRQVLREQRKVYVPEIGTFTLIQSPARLSDTKLKIDPPQLNIRYDDDQSNDSSLKNYIKDTGRFSNSKIEKAISDFTQRTFNKLINVNKSEILGLGTLIKVENEEKVSFLPTLDLFTREFKDLKTIDLTLVERIKEENLVSHAIDTSDVSARAPGRFSWLQPIIAGIVIAALAIFIVKSCRNYDDTTYQNPEVDQIGAIDDTTNQQDETEVNNELSSDSVGIIEELDKEYEEVDKMLQGRSKINFPDSKLEEELSQLELSEESIKDLPKTKDTTVKSITKEKELESPNPSINKYADIIPSSGNCIIILGSFKRASNITRMISLIEREGKNVYQSQYQGKTRVGFKFDCTEVEIEEYLNDVRERLSSKAWYLDPTVSIPYN